MKKYISKIMKIMRYSIISYKLKKSSQQTIIVYLAFGKKSKIIVTEPGFFKICTVGNEPNDFISPAFKILTEDIYKEIDVWNKPRAPKHQDKNMDFIFVPKKNEDMCKSLTKNDCIKIYTY